MGLTEDEVSWLINNDDDLTTILNIQDEYPEESLAYFVWVISQNLLELEDLIETYEEFNPDFFPEPGEGEVEEIQNGIEIVESHPVDPDIGITPGPLQADSEYRHPHDPPNIIAPDMDFGTNGNTDLLTPNGLLYSGTISLLDETNTELFDRMEDLMDWFTLDDSAPEDLVLNTFIPRFKNSIGEDLESKKLNEIVENTNEMKNFVKEFGVAINEKLKEQTGTIDFNNIPEFELPQIIRPRFSNGYTNYRVNGLKIMINDTEQTNVYTQSFDINQTTGDWTGVFLVEILDHFGLDDTDLTTFQEKPLGVGRGFAAWWILQHIRDHEPFRTKVRILYTITGNIND